MTDGGLWTALGGGGFIGGVLAIVGTVVSRKVRSATPYDQLSVRISNLETQGATNDRHIRILATGFDVVWRDRQRLLDGGSTEVLLSDHDEQAVALARQLVTYGDDKPLKL